MSIAIVKGDFHDKHSTSWSREWCKICERQGLDYKLIDWRARGAIDKLATHGIVLWHFSHYSSGEMLFARSILFALKENGCLVFPDFPDSWHFDDKVAQAFLFDVLNIPTPRNDVLFSNDAVESWIEKEGTFPVVAKLRTGSGSSNVRLIRSRKELRTYTKNSFGKGFNPSPGIGFKLASNLRSSHSFSDIVKRAKRAPEFFFSLMRARALPREKGYVYLQKFIPGAEYDIKVVVVGGKMGFIGRRIRPGDFRASGGGDLFSDRTIITPRVIEVGFAAADAMKTDCTGFDMVVESETGEPYIVEVSYGFSHTALMETGGYFDRTGNWHDAPLNAPQDILNNLMKHRGS